MSAMMTYKCECCGEPFEARTADRARGWARYCSKSCKAIKQTKDTGISGPHYAASGQKVPQMRCGEYAESRFDGDDTHPFSSDALGQW